MRLKHTTLRLAGAAMIAAAVVPWLGGGTASATETAYVDAKWDGTNSATSNVTQDDCSYTEVTMNHAGQGWHFVLPGGTGLTEFTANFASAGKVTVTTTDGPNGVIVQDGKGAVVYTTAGDDILESTSDFADHPGQGTAATAPNLMQLSHLCNGEGIPPSSPPPSSSAPETTPPTSSAPESTPPSSAPVTSATTVAVVPSVTQSSAAAPAVSVLPTKVENTTAEASPETSVLAEAEELPHTGGGIPYTALVVLSLGLLLAGGALMLLPGLRVEKAGRRH